MTRFHPRSPGARLSALRRALWEEDRARKRVRMVASRIYGPKRVRPTQDELDEAFGVRDRAESERMEAERDLWEAMAGHGLD